MAWAGQINPDRAAAHRRSCRNPGAGDSVHIRPLRLLVGGDRTAAQRHQTLQATINWSYELLTPSEQGLLGQLSVFTGNWTIEAAESVCLGPDLAAMDVLKLLGNLVA